jgi:transcriptional regulator with XRE-family HTH domain
MSQSKISRLERNKLAPTAVDVELILRALDVEPDSIATITNLAYKAATEFQTDRHFEQAGWAHKQQEMRTLEDASSEIRFFLPAMLAGLLQTKEYTLRAIRQAVPVGGDLSSVIPTLAERKKTLRSGACHFQFILTESAVRWPYLEPQLLSQQMRHLIELSLLPTVSIGIIPLVGKIVEQGPMNTFVIYDRRLVSIEISSGEVSLIHPRNIAYHLELFDYFAKQALSEKESRQLLHELVEEFSDNPKKKALS